MAKKRKHEIGLPLTEKVELVATKGDKVYKSILPYGEALKVKKKPGWNYQCYQVGYCSIKENR